MVTEPEILFIGSHGECENEENAAWRNMGLCAKGAFKVMIGWQKSGIGNDIFGR